MYLLKQLNKPETTKTNLLNFKTLNLYFMQNFIKSLAVLDIILFISFFIGINFIFYKLITEVLKGNKTAQILAAVSIIALNALFISILLLTFLNF
jgi:hypothetical protein